jgi:DNA-binding GntR family transcriptional regulator
MTEAIMRQPRAPKLSAASAVDRVYEIVREGIIQGRWPAGAHLRETLLAEETGVSRTPVREALQKLAAVGLVEYTPNQGARVVSWSDQALDEIFSLRTMLEAYAAQQAARRISSSGVDELERLCDVMEDAAREKKSNYLDAIGEANRMFHAGIVRAADCGRLAVTLQGLVDFPLVMRTYQHYTGSQLARSLEHHREIVAALRARESEWAGSVMRSHIYAARFALRQARG